MSETEASFDFTDRSQSWVMVEQLWITLVVVLEGFTVSIPTFYR